MPSPENTVAKRKFDSLEQEAYLSLWRTYDRLKSLEDAFFSRWNLTAQQYNVLRILQSAGKPVATLAIASKLISRAPDITRMLDKLESEEWVERSRSDSDRRTVLVSITSSGKKRLGDLEGPLQELHEQQLGHLPAKDLRLMCDLLAKVREPHEAEDSAW
jgi:DNA-binding MarR family transcriptional regulator